MHPKYNITLRDACTQAMAFRTGRLIFLTYILKFVINQDSLAAAKILPNLLSSRLNIRLSQRQWHSLFVNKHPRDLAISETVKKNVL